MEKWRWPPTPSRNNMFFLWIRHDSFSHPTLACEKDINRTERVPQHSLVTPRTHRLNWVLELFSINFIQFWWDLSSLCLACLLPVTLVTWCCMIPALVCLQIYAVEPNPRTSVYFSLLFQFNQQWLMPFTTSWGLGMNILKCVKSSFQPKLSKGRSWLRCSSPAMAALQVGSHATIFSFSVVSCFVFSFAWLLSYFGGILLFAFFCLSFSFVFLSCVFHFSFLFISYLLFVLSFFLCVCFLFLFFLLFFFVFLTCFFLFDWETNETINDVIPLTF